MLGLFWLCLFICEALDKDLGHFLSNHHRSCCILAGCSHGSSWKLRGVRERLNCLHCTITFTTTLRASSSSSFSLAGGFAVRRPTSN